MRVKRGVTARARHNKIRKATKGMTLAHRSSVRRGKQAVVRSLENAYNDRRNKKRTFRQLMEHAYQRGSKRKRHNLQRSHKWYEEEQCNG
jgi:large subunit ribosomal protein L20